MRDAENKTPGPESAHAGDHPMSGFGATRWTLVMRVAEGDAPGAMAALEQLCRIYWYPIYWFIRSHYRYNHHDAQDLTQAFFAHLLQKETLKKVVRGKARFRSFLLGALVKVLANEWDRIHTLKRGGGNQPISIDEAAAQGLYGCEPVEEETPDKAFDRQWAAALLRQTHDRLRKEYHETGKGALFSELESVLAGTEDGLSYPERAARLQMSVGALRVAVHRLRARFRELLRSEVAQTVSSQEEVDDELRHLMDVIAG
jgi:RNA polymerase sigma-70 factor (ECF subfamily)